MTVTVRAVFDGQVFRPEQPVDLEPDKSYELTVQGVADVPPVDEEPYPLSVLASLATDMGVDDLAERHDAYAHRKIGQTDEPDRANSE